jgi:hypothetical protein
MSHYEFETPNAVRRTDKEWKAELLDGKVPPRPDWTKDYLVPAAERMKVEGWKRKHMIDD